MFMDDIYIDGLEGADTYVEGNELYAHTMTTQAVQELASKVETCGGSGNRSVSVAIYSLVAVNERWIGSNVRGKRNGSCVEKLRPDIGWIPVEPEDPLPVCSVLSHGADE